MTLEENYLFTGSDDQTIKIWVKKYYKLNKIFLKNQINFSQNCLAKNRFLLWTIDNAHEVGVKELLIIENTGI